jgi:RCR-type E3 ubiquitin transferase
MFDRENKDRRIFSRLNSENKFQSKSNIDEQGAVGGTTSTTIWCDLCNSDINSQNDSNSFTSHLKKSHPGCGESAKGKGYNSNGVYCEGWAGQCGEEGVGATSWYLMCESCRDRHMMPQKKTNKLYVNNSLSTKTIQESQEAAAAHTTNTSSMAFSKKAVKSFSNYNFEIFGTMRDNALFLLDLNSHNGTLLSKTPGNDLIAVKSRSCVRQNSLGDFRTQNPSPSHHRFSSTFVEEKLRKATLQKQMQNSPCYNPRDENSTKTDFLWSPPETITCLDVLNTRIGESESCNNFSIDNGRNFSMIGQNSIRPTNLMNENKFHRSFSMVQGWDFFSTSNDNNHDDETEKSQWIEINNSTQNRDGQVVMRRKKKCLCDSSKF